MSAAPPEPAVTEDALLGGRLRLRQPAEGFRAAIDPILLAAAVPARPGERALDLGCGVGTAGLALMTRIPDLQVVGVELDADLAALAEANAAMNGLERGYQARPGDVGDPALFSEVPAFDHVLCNPPFLPAARGRGSPDSGRRQAMEEGAPLEVWVETGLRLLRPKGSLTMIHRADRLEALLAALKDRAGEIAVVPLWPVAREADPSRPAKRVIVGARKGLRSPTRLLPGLVLHGPDGSYTPEANAVLRDAAPLAL